MYMNQKYKKSKYKMKTYNFFKTDYWTFTTLGWILILIFENKKFKNIFDQKVQKFNYENFNLMRWALPQNCVQLFTFLKSSHNLQADKIFVFFKCWKRSNANTLYIID